MSLYRLYSIDDAADLCQMSKSWFYKYVKAGRIPATRYGRSIRIAEDVLERLLRGEFEIPQRLPSAS